MMAYRPELDLLILVPSVIALLITGWALFVAVPRVQGWLWERQLQRSNQRVWRRMMARHSELPPLKLDRNLNRRRR